MITVGFAAAQIHQAVGAEYFWDADPGVGNGLPLLSADGNFDEVIETALESTATLPATGLHTFSVRFEEVGGAWGPTFSVSLLIDQESSTQRNISVSQAEYFWDIDPGLGSGVPILAFDGNFDEAIEVAVFGTSSLPGIGGHNLSIRILSTDGVWSSSFSSIIEIDESTTSLRNIEIAMAEMFWDADPGQGSGTPLLAFDGNFNEAFEIASLFSSSIPAIGNHVFNVRFLSADGTWSTIFSTIVKVDEASTALRNVKITMAEMFWDADPGQGNGTGMIAFDENFDEAIEQATICTGIFPEQGAHKFSIRFRDAENQWSSVFSTIILIDEQTTALRNIRIQLAEYFWDTDPGQGSAQAMMVIDGNYNEAMESVSSTMSISLSIGVHTLNVRTKDPDGNWSPLFRSVVVVNEPATEQRNIYVAAAEYWFDIDPGAGSATPIVSADGSFNEAIETIIGGDIPSPVISGLHTLYMRSRDPQGAWGNKFGIVVNMDIDISTFSTAIDGPVDICAGTEQLNKSYYALAAAGSTYAWSITGGFILTGQGTPQILINWNSGAIHTLNLQQCLSGTCQNFALNVNLHPTTNTTDYVSICEGDSYFAGGALRTEAGVYADNLQSQFGCDSIVTTVLSITDVIIVNQSVEICQGEFVFLGGIAQTTSGTYLDSYTSASGCDSLVYTLLTVRPTYFNNVVVEICTSQSYFANGAYQTSSGFYTDLFQTIHGCDSIVVTQLVVGTSFHTTYVIDICEGETYFAGGWNQSLSGAYVDFIGTTCTEIRTTYLTVHSTYDIELSVEIFNGEMFYAGGDWQTDTGVYTDYLTTSFGCDSIVTTIISVIPVHNDIQFVTICDGESFFAEGAEQTTSGIYVDVISGICTSTVSTFLTVNPSYNDTNFVQICTGQTYFAAGAEQNTSGIYIDQSTTTLGCDSSIITVLTVFATLDIDQTVYICHLDSLFVGGDWQFAEGVYVDVMFNGVCTESITTTLVVQENATEYINVSICEGLQYFAEGQYQSESGVYSDLYQSSTGCDSTVVTTLVFIPPIISNVEAFICEGDQIFLGGSNQTLEGIYFDTLQNPLTGCDIIISTALVYYPNAESNEILFICPGDSTLLGGEWQTAPDLYVEVLQTVNGCDSAVNTLLQWYPTFNTPISESVCAGDSIFLAENWQTVPGDYIDLFQSVDGCDSIVTTTLSVLPTSETPEVLDNGDSSVSSSLQGDSYVWTIDGLGCDMIVIETTQSDLFLTPYCISSQAFVVSVSRIVNGCQSGFSEQRTIIIASCSQINDQCLGAVLLQVDGPVLIDSNQCATNSGEEEASCTADIGRSVWYRFTTNSTHDLTVSVANVVPITSAFNPKLEIFTGPCGALAEVVCQNVGGNNQDETYFLENPPSGQTYFVRVSGVLVQSGSYQISIIDESECPGDFDGNGFVNVTDLLIFITDLGCLNNCTTDMDGNGLVNIVDLLIFASVYGSECE